MIQVAELLCNVAVTRRQPLPATVPEASAQDIAPAAPPPGQAPTVDARHIADIVYRMMRDDLAILRERT
jgi:hypothetical protein